MAEPRRLAPRRCCNTYWESGIWRCQKEWRADIESLTVAGGKQSKEVMMYDLIFLGRGFQRYCCIVKVDIPYRRILKPDIALLIKNEQQLLLHSSRRTLLCILESCDTLTRSDRTL